MSLTKHGELGAFRKRVIIPYTWIEHGCLGKNDEK